MSDTPYVDNHKSPVLAVDIVVWRYKEDPNEYLPEILLIERKYPPYGWALPGGHVDIGESCETAAARELKEETSLEAKHIHQFKVYSDPNRDPRKHVVSVVYGAFIDNQEPKAGDDAKNFCWLSVYDFVMRKYSFNICFDHKQIIQEFINTFL